MDHLPEPWMRGPVAGVHPLTTPILYCFQQAREDLAKYTDGLTPQQIWASPHGFGSVGFHLRHIAGSTDRLMTYLQGRPLSGPQMAALEAEKQPDGRVGQTIPFGGLPERAWGPREVPPKSRGPWETTRRAGTSSTLADQGDAEQGGPPRSKAETRAAPPEI